MLSVEEKFTKARIILLRGDPFIGKFLLLLGDPIDVSGNGRKNYKALKDLETMATTGTKLYYNKKYVDKLNFKEFLSLILHQLLHCIMMHSPRGVDKSQKLWNMAADLWVNERLKRNQNDYRENRDIDYILFEDSLTSDDKETSDMSVDDIYIDFLEQFNDQVGDAKSDLSLGGEGESGQSGSDFIGGSGGDGDIILDIGNKSVNIKDFEMDMISPESVGESSEDLMKQISKMNVSSNVHSTIVGQGTSLVTGEEIAPRKASSKWYKYLDRYLSKIFRFENSYSTPNKNLLYTRRIHQGPRRSVSKKLTSVIIAVDFSASVWNNREDLEKFWFHISNIAKKYKAEGRILLWDTKVRVDLDLSKFNTNKEYDLPKGGTDPTTVYDYLKEKNMKYDVLVMLTDSYFKEKELKILENKDNRKTMWVTSGDHRAFMKLKNTIRKGKVFKLK